MAFDAEQARRDIEKLRSEMEGAVDDFNTPVGRWQCVARLEGCIGKMLQQLAQVQLESLILLQQIEENTRRGPP